MRMDGPHGSHMTWGLGDPVASDGWASPQVAMARALLPHIRQFVRVRQALVGAEAHNTTVAALLDTPGSASSTWTGGGRSSRRTTAPVASSDTAMGCRRRMGRCVPARRATSSVCSS